MRPSLWAVLPLLRVWAAQAGVPCGPALQRSCARAVLGLPAQGRSALFLAGLALRPLCWLRPDAAGRALEHLQTLGWPPLRGPFLLVKSAVLPAVWGRP